MKETTTNENGINLGNLPLNIKTLITSFLTDEKDLKVAKLINKSWNRAATNFKLIQKYKHTHHLIRNRHTFSIHDEASAAVKNQLNRYENLYISLINHLLTQKPLVAMKVLESIIKSIRSRKRFKLDNHIDFDMDNNFIGMINDIFEAGVLFKYFCKSDYTGVDQELENIHNRAIMNLEFLIKIHGHEGKKDLFYLNREDNELFQRAKKLNQSFQPVKHLTKKSFFSNVMHSFEMKVITGFTTFVSSAMLLREIYFKLSENTLGTNIVFSLDLLTLAYYLYDFISDQQQKNALIKKGEQVLNDFFVNNDEQDAKFNHK